MGPAIWLRGLSWYLNKNNGIIQGNIIMSKRKQDFIIGTTILVERKDGTFTEARITNIIDGKVLFESPLVKGRLNFDSKKIKFKESYWPFKHGLSEIWYSKRPFIRSLNKKPLTSLSSELLPTAANLDTTHVKMGTMDDVNKLNIYNKLRNRDWIPDNEIENLKSIKDVDHVNMIPGDIIKIGSHLYMIDVLGFIDLDKE